MADIFISYEKEDRARIEPLAKALADQGWTVWWDRKIPAGLTWREVIGEALEAARVVVVAWSDTSVQSRWVVEEADWGLERKILVPIFLDDVRPPLGFSSVQAVDLSQWNPSHPSDRFDKLVSDLELLLGESPLKTKAAEQQLVDQEAEEDQRQEEENRRPTHSDQGRKPGIKKGRLVGIVVLVLAVIAAGVWYNAFINKRKLEAHYNQQFVEITEQLEQQIQEAKEASSADHLEEIINRTQDTVFRRWEELVPEAGTAGMDIAEWEKRFGDISGHWREVVEAKGQELAMNAHVERGPQDAVLYVDTTPEDATIAIMNIRPRFQQGMELAPGEYHLQVSADEYEKMDLWVNLEPGQEKRLEVRLEYKPEPIKEPEKNISNSIGMEFVYIPPGTFVMGSSDSEPGRDDDERQHKVTLPRGFYMQTTEVTQGQWQAVMKNNPSNFKACGDGCPVETVSWNDAQDFIEKLNARDGDFRYRLPTEAEWEYACRAGITTAYAFGNDAEELPYNAWYRDNSKEETHPVGRKKPNPWGLQDMHGNLWEWCRDWYGAYPREKAVDPSGPSRGVIRVLRGGAWSSPAENCRSANRFRDNPDLRSRYIGFRLVCLPGQ